MEVGKNGRQLKWKMTKMKGDQNGGRPKWNLNKIEDDQHKITTCSQGKVNIALVM